MCRPKLWSSGMMEHFYATSWSTADTNVTSALEKTLKSFPVGKSRTHFNRLQMDSVLVHVFWKSSRWKTQQTWSSEGFSERRRIEQQFEEVEKRWRHGENTEDLKVCQNSGIREQICCQTKPRTVTSPAFNHKRLLMWSQIPAGWSKQKRTGMMMLKICPGIIIHSPIISQTFNRLKDKI